MGLGARNRLLLGDEPGSWERRDGALMFEALTGRARQGGRLAAAHDRDQEPCPSWGLVAALA